MKKKDDFFLSYRYAPIHDIKRTVRQILDSILIEEDNVLTLAEISRFPYLDVIFPYLEAIFRTVTRSRCYWSKAVA